MLVSEVIPRDRYLDCQIGLLGDLCGVFHSDEVQVVILDEEPPLLA